MIWTSVFQFSFSANETSQLVVYKSPKINTGAQLGIGLSLALHVGVDRSEVSTKEIILTTTTMASPIILGMGNPLLDISATVTPAMLEKYGLKANDAILYEKEDLYDELLKDYKVDYIAGGATQNSCRVAQWLLPDKKSVAFFGCVGKLIFFVIFVLSNFHSYF